MQIKYLKDAPLGATGEIHEVEDSQARVLILLGIAEPAGNKKPKTTKKTNKTQELDLTDEPV
ncbi:hypothetical protein [Moraxella bovoculi]|uniref:hypothetical protein n=1 Tax=Moraxella bovoculi TaxID=386891 RepID=UPI0006247C8B|nr:hypothetical protein [Moraxella bovoculi]AKG15610.2 hypothetical protein AAX08_06480 [Moraxella bovoculi]